MDTFRARLRAFLSEHHPGPPPRRASERLEHRRAWAATLVEHGYAAPAWPKAWGGMELPLEMQLAYHEEMVHAKVPSHPQGNNFIVGPTIGVHGTDEQRKRFMPRLLRGDDLWCQGWSEPEAGSDLPSLRTRAVRDGDCYRVTGQKIWTTNANICNWMFALVRTGSDGSRERGISYLLIEMSTPGIEVRPLRDMSGRHDFAEIFLDDVRVPVANLVGNENEGWSIARISMGHERSTAFLAQDFRYRATVRELIALAREHGRDTDPVVRQQLARLETDVRLLALNGSRVLAGLLRGEEPGPASSIARLLSSQFEQRLHEFAVELHGPSGTLAPDDPHAPERGRWLRGFLSTRASTIGAGTAEIQRNTIAERVLGLPREPAGNPDR